MQLWIAISALAATCAGAIAWFALSRVFSPQEGQAVANDADEQRKRRFERPELFGALSRLISSAFPQSRTKRRDLADRLSAAGSQMTPDMYRASSVLFAAVGAILGLLGSSAFGLSGLRFAAVVAMVTALGAFWPRISVASKTKKRRKDIEAKLPSALEMLSASVKAGLSMERALDIVSSRTQGVVSEEFRRCVNDIAYAGYSTPEALRKMDECCQVPSMTLFCASAAQAIDQGSAIGDVLASQAKIARQNHFQAIEEEANKLPTKMVIPLILFILPGTIIVSLAPAALQIVGTFGNM